jgi:hypothetical protein
MSTTKKRTPHLKSPRVGLRAAAVIWTNVGKMHSAFGALAESYHNAAISSQNINSTSWGRLEICGSGCLHECVAANVVASGTRNLMQ